MILSNLLKIKSKIKIKKTPQDINEKSWKNFQKNGAHFKPVKESDFPQMIFVELTNRCNLTCITCPRDSMTSHGTGDMSRELFNKIIDEIAQHKGVILRPFSDGESLLHHEAIEMIQYAKQKCGRNARLWLNTNGILLDEKRARGLLEAKLDHLEVSVDAATTEEYKRTRGGDFKRVVENVKRYYQLKKKLSPRSLLTVSMVETTDNSHLVSEFKQFWKPYCDSVEMRTFHKVDESLERNMKVERLKGERYPCPQLWRRFIINYDGKARFCVEDVNNRGIIGDINKETIYEVWNSDRYEQLRQLHVKGLFTRPPCDECESFLQWRWDVGA